MSSTVGLAGITWRGFLGVSVFAVAGVMSAGAAALAAYPERTVTIIVPFAPGGGSDVVARVLGKYLSETLGKSVVVENRAGAGGNIGVGAAARARPDGHTLLVASSIMVVNPSLYKPVPFDPFKDFVPIVDLGASPNVIVTRVDSGINTLTDLIALAKNKPNLLKGISKN